MSSSSFKNIVLLYVEDDKDIREELVELLEDECHQLYVAENGEDGLELFKEHQPDIVLSDIRMSKMDGLTMSRAIHELAPQTPIIISSAFNDSDYLLEAIRLGIHYYLLKPIDLKELFVTLEKISLQLLQDRRLQQSEKLLTQYKELVDKNTVVSKTNKEGVITYANDAFCRLSGYSHDELIGSPHNIIRHPDNPKSLFKEMWRSILDKKEWHGIIKNLSKENKTYMVDTTILPVLNDREEIEEFISIRQDVTQRELDKQNLQEKLQTSVQTLDEKIQFIYEYENALKKSTLFCRTTVDGTITMASNAFVKLLGHKERTLIGSSYFPFVDESDIAILNKEVRDAINHHKIWKGMVKHQSAQGETLYLKSSFIPIMDINNKVYEVFCFYADLTKQEYLNREIIATQREVIATMGTIGESRSQETGDHVKRVAEYSKLLALKSGITLEKAEELKMASPMHDIGKVGIPDNILNKPGKLSEDEFEVMKTHAMLGFDMLKGSKQPLLETASIIALTHHEKWDGSGYPYGLKEEEIHIYGRITAIADVFDALGHDRVYKKAWPLEDILEIFKEGRGKHFDPNLIDLFFKHLDEFLAIKDNFETKDTVHEHL